MFNKMLFACMFFCCCTVMNASDARYVGMGNLSLLFPDEFHRLDLYDFAAIPAALMNNDTVQFFAVRASGLTELWPNASLKYLAIGQAFPQKLTDYMPLEAAAALYSAVPMFSLSPAEFVYSSCQAKEKFDDFGNVSKPQAWRLYGGWGQLNQTYADSLTDNIKTPALAFAYSKPVSENLSYGFSGDLFYGMFNSAGGHDKATLFPVGGGGGVAFGRHPLSVGLNVEYHYPMFDFSETFGTITYAEKYSGHAVSPSLGVTYQIDNLSWVTAANFKWLNMNGHHDTLSVGSLKSTGYLAKSQLYYSTGMIRAAGLVFYDNRSPSYTDETGNIWFNSSFLDYGVGIGIGLVMNKLNAGLEALIRQDQIDEKITPETFKARNMVFKAGLEYSLIKTLLIRAGYNYVLNDPDLSDADDRFKAHVITGGFGINAMPDFRFDVGYNYRMGKTESDPNEKVTDHIFFAYFKYTIRANDNMF